MHNQNTTHSGIARTVMALTAACLALTPAAALAQGPGGPQPPISAGAKPPDLTQIYRGSDGGALYLRSEGSTVVGFAEHPIRKYAFVFSGKLSNDVISGSWRDVAKGTRTTFGAIKLTVSAGGDKLWRSAGADFGPDAFTAIDASKVPWPGAREAGFQSSNRLDLDGAFIGKTAQETPDKSRQYWRETNAGTFGVAEGAPPAGSTRPAWVSVFVGKRDASGLVKGEYFDVPKGTASQRGSFKLSLTAKSYGRRYGLEQLNANNGVLFGRSSIIEADYAVNFDKFAAAWDKYFRGHVVGFGYAISHDGKIVRSGGGGSRYLKGTDKKSTLPNLAFTANTQSDIGSSSKLIVATAVIRELGLRGMPLTSKVAAYFPSCWKLPADMQTLTFQDLINHQAGLTRFTKAERAASLVDDPSGYSFQKAVAEGGRSGQKGYYNQNYVHLGWVLAGLLDKAKVEASFAKHGCGAGTPAMLESMQIFEAYVTKMLASQGINASWRRDQANFAWMYSFTNQKAGGAISPENINPSGGLKMTASELGDFMAKLEAGRFVSRATVLQMKLGSLGFDGPWPASDGLGRMYTKNGGTGDGLRGYASQVAMLPSGVQILGVWNSTDNDVTVKVPVAMLKAWEAAIK